MKIEIGNSSAFSQDPIEIQKIRALIQRILRDGYISRQERDTLMHAIYVDKKVTPDECEQFRLIQEKVWSGEIRISD